MKMENTIIWGAYCLQCKVFTSCKEDSCPPCLQCGGYTCKAIWAIVTENGLKAPE